MKLNKKSCESSSLRLVLLTVILLTVYYPIIFLDQTVNPDAQMILENLKNFSSWSEYFKALRDFKTLDFQPLRDLSFYLDLKIYDVFNINTLIKFNIIIWIFSIHLLFEILKKIFPHYSQTYLFLVTIVFAVNPLFSTSICWGMARKHLLSFFFILAATNEALGSRRSTAKMIFYYSLSILSQPISLLWPLWLIFYDYCKSINLRKFYYYVSVLFIMSADIIINFKYYNESSVYKEIYSPKGGDLFDIIGRIQVFGHYFYQTIFPYQLAFNYKAGGIETDIGIVLFLAFISFCFVKIDSKKKIFVWMIFSFFPLAIVSTDAGLLSDTYLLIPTVGIFILFLHLKENKEIPKYLPFCGILLAVFWGIRSNFETDKWRDSLSFAANDFKKNENCTSALLNARMGYLSDQKIVPNLKNFIAINNCLNIDSTQLKSNFRFNEFLTVSIYMLYYENDFNRDQKINGLQKLSQTHYLASFFLAALAIDEKNNNRANDIITDVISKSLKDLAYSYEPIVAEKILPYCLNQKNFSCSDFMKYFSTLNKSLYY